MRGRGLKRQTITMEHGPIESPPMWRRVFWGHKNHFNLTLSD